MQESVTLDELDLALLNALQIRPRVGWTELGRVLGVDPGTLARRWSRLTESGSAWVTCYPGAGASGSLAYVEVRAAPGAVREVATTLASDPHVLTVELLSGTCDLLLVVAATELAVLARYVLHRLSAVPGVTEVGTRLVTRLFGEGSRWRLRSLEPAQNRALGEAATRTMARRPPTKEDEALLLALGEDGRMSYAELADRTGLSPATARRRMARLLAAGSAVLRCEVAHSLSGWPVSLTLWAQAPPPALEEIARWTMTLPEMRSIAALVGPANLVMFAWLRSPEDSLRLEVEITRRFPALTVTDRALTLETVKQMGRLVDAAGRCVGNVPMALWSDPVP